MVNRKNVQLLYIEDDLAHARLLQKKVDKHGYKVDIAHDSMEGLSMLKQSLYDILLLDYNIPGGGGLNIIRCLITEKRLPPTIMITGEGNEKVAVEAMKLGAYDYIIKDVNCVYIELLPTVIDRALEQRSLAAEKDEAVKQLQKLSFAVEQSPSIVVITDPEGNVEYTNSKFTKVTGFSFDEVAGKPLRLLEYDKKKPELHQELWETIKSGREWHGEYLGKKKCGELFWEQISISSIKNVKETITHFVVLKEDITARKKIAEELVKAKEKAEAATLLKDKFLAIVAHDLRSPFIAMIGMIKLLQKNTAFKLDKKSKEIINKVVATGEHLEKFIANLLSINRLQAGHIRIKPVFFNAFDFSQNVISHINHLAQQKSIDITNNIPENIRLYGDPDLLAEVIQNIVANSIKFCPKGANINLFVPEDASASIAVADTGIGVSPELLNTIFQYDSKSSTIGTSGEKGAGLGLPLCREIMVAHGGEINVSSTPGEGSVFCVSLPMLPSGSKHQTQATVKT